MKALIFDGNLKLEKDYKKPEIKDNEVLIKTTMTGICNTDYEITKGYMGYKGVLGHEFVGIVVELGKNAPQNLLNKKVTGGINCACENCTWCYQGLQRHCPNRTTLGIYKKDGCFSEYFTLPYKNILQIPNNVNDTTAVFTEPLAAAYEIIEQIHIKPCDKVAIVGDGKLGLCISLIFNALNINYVHIGKHSDKLAISKALGAKTKLLNELDNRDIMNYDVVVEATGSTGGFDTSVSLTKPRGTLVLKSTINAKEGLNLATVVVNEINIVGSRCGQFEPVLRLMEQNKINVEPLISGIYNVDQFKEAFEKNAQKDTLKILVKF